MHFFFISLPVCNILLLVNFLCLHLKIDTDSELKEQLKATIWFLLTADKIKRVAIPCHPPWLNSLKISTKKMAENFPDSYRKIDCTLRTQQQAFNPGPKECFRVLQGFIISHSIQKYAGNFLFLTLKWIFFIFSSNSSLILSVLWLYFWSQWLKDSQTVLLFL